MFGVWPLTASKPQKRKFFSFFFKFNLTNELYIASGPQKGILLGGFIRGQMVLQWRLDIVSKLVTISVVVVDEFDYEV